MFFRKTIGVKEVSSTRYQIFNGVKKRELEKIALNKTLKTLQFSEPLSYSEVKNLESVVFSKRPDITLRVYGYYGKTCDLSFLENIPSLVNICADCIYKAEGVNVLARFSNLETLSIGIYDLENFDFLDLLPSSLRELSLQQTLSKRPSIEAIGRFRNLTYLYLEGQQKGIDAVNQLKNLESVVLRSISTEDVSYLEGLKKLWSVDIKLGGIKDLTSLSNVKNLKYLELWQILGLSDLSFISNISSLQNLFIQSLKQLTRLPSFDNSYQLRRLYLENLKGLTDLSTLEFAPSLTEFIYVLAQNQKPDNLLPVLLNKSVKSVSCGFGSHRKNRLFSELAMRYGKQEYAYSEFKYR